MNDHVDRSHHDAPHPEHQRGICMVMIVLHTRSTNTIRAASGNCFWDH
jgi:hypothetical protein